MLEVLCIGDEDVDDDNNKKTSNNFLVAWLVTCMLILTSDYKALNREPRSSQLFSR
jgi:hypothetical protein